MRGSQLGMSVAKNAAGGGALGGWCRRRRPREGGESDLDDDGVGVRQRRCRRGVVDGERRGCGWALLSGQRLIAAG
jgi:hypothetical protein